MTLFKREKPYKLVFLRQEYKSLYIFKIINLSNIPKIYKLGKGHQYTIDVATPSFNNKLTKVYLFDYDTGSQYTFKQIKRELNPEELDLIVGTKIITELTKSIVDNKKQYVFYAIIGFIIGALLAAIIVMMIFNGKIQDILQLQIDNPEPRIPFLGVIRTLIK